jgi:hypothetical protein
VRSPMSFRLRLSRALAKLYQCGITTLERSGVPPEGVQAACLVGRGPVSLSYACC